MDQSGPESSVTKKTFQHRQDHAMPNKPNLRHLIETVESDHCCIEELLRQLDSAISQNQATLLGPTIIQNVADILAKHVVSEESLMNMIGYKHSSKHAADHNKMLVAVSDVSSISHTLRESGWSEAAALIWSVYQTHIDVHDQPLFDCFSSLELSHTNYIFTHCDLVSAS